MYSVKDILDKEYNLGMVISRTAMPRDCTSGAIRARHENYGLAE